MSPVGHLATGKRSDKAFIWFHISPYVFIWLVVSECAAVALPMVERVGLVTGDFGVLGGEGEADLPGKKDRACGYQLKQSSGALHSTVSKHASLFLS